MDYFRIRKLLLHGRRAERQRGIVERRKVAAPAQSANTTSAEIRPGCLLSNRIRNVSKLSSANTAQSSGAIAAKRSAPKPSRERSVSLPVGCINGKLRRRSSTTITSAVIILRSVFLWGGVGAAGISLTTDV